MFLLSWRCWDFLFIYATTEKARAQIKYLKGLYSKQPKSAMNYFGGVHPLILLDVPFVMEVLGLSLHICNNGKSSGTDKISKSFILPAAQICKELFRWCSSSHSLGCSFCHGGVGTFSSYMQQRKKLGHR